MACGGLGTAPCLSCLMCLPLTSEPLRSCAHNLLSSSMCCPLLASPSQQGNRVLLYRLCHVSEEDMALEPSQDSRRLGHPYVWPVPWQAGTLVPLWVRKGEMEHKLNTLGNGEEKRSSKRGFDPGLYLCKTRMQGPWDKERKPGLEISADKSCQWLLVCTSKCLPVPRPQSS